MVSPLLSADISALIRRYLRSCWQISSPMAFHIPIHSANGDAMNFLMNPPRDKLKIHATEYGNKDFIPYLYARKQGRGGGGFHFFGSINSVCYLFILYWNLGNFKAMKGRTSCKRPRIGVDVTCLFHRLPRAAIQGELVHVFFVCLRYISEDMA